MAKVRKLFFASFVEADDLFDKCLVVSSKLIAIFLQVKDGSALGLYFIDIEVEDASDLVASLSALNILTLLKVALLCRLLCRSKLMLNAEVIVTALILPEALQWLAFKLAE